MPPLGVHLSSGQLDWIQVHTTLDHQMPVPGGTSELRSTKPNLVPVLVTKCLYQGVFLSDLTTYPGEAFKSHLHPQLQINNNNIKKTNLHTHSTFLFNSQELISTLQQYSDRTSHSTLLHCNV